MMDGWTERGRDGLDADDRVLGGLIAAIVCAVRNLFPRVGRGGAPEEIVGAVLYLASDAASYTTGAHLQVDRGYVPVR